MWPNSFPPSFQIPHFSKFALFNTVVVLFSHFLMCFHQTSNCTFFLAFKIDELTLVLTRLHIYFLYFIPNLFYFHVIETLNKSHTYLLSRAHKARLFLLSIWSVEKKNTSKWKQISNIYLLIKTWKKNLSIPLRNSFFYLNFVYA